MPQAPKKYIIDDEHLMQEWDWKANADLDPAKLTIGSNKKAWWKCKKCEHEWQATIASRGWSHQGCPVCANRVVVVGKNDLATTHPELAKEWHPTKNSDLKPTDVVAGSGTKVWWQCPKCGQEWQTVIVSRGLGNHGCPKCSKIKGRRKQIEHLIKRQGSLAENLPELAKEWHPTKNGDLKPTDVTANSRKKVWWRCPVGHEYPAVIGNRRYTNCPICNSRKSSSFPEQAIFYYLKKLWPNALNKYKNCHMGKMELDIYIPEIKTAIEYDGVQYHKTNIQHTREIKKYEFCKKHEIYLIRIKECSTQSWDDTADKVYNIPVQDKKNFHSLEQVIQQLLCLIGKDKQFSEKIDIEHDKNEILSYLSKIDNSLTKKRPDIAAKWNYEKNGKLTPDMFSVGSNDIVWWKCPDCGKEWKTRISTMSQEIYGCPECSKIKQGRALTKLFVKKRGSLAEKMPELASEWHPTRNGDLKPIDITIGSGKKVWWKCSKCGYEWQTVVANRGIAHQGCPVCANQVCIPGKNDLATTNPELAKEWHPTKNGNLKPTDVVDGSGKKVWWKCSECGHEYLKLVLSRGVNHEGCPECSKIEKGKKRIKMLIEKHGTFAENMPELAKEWHLTKNGNLKPTDISAGTHTKVWWKCSKCGHSWQAEIRRRVKGSKCPKCHGCNKSSQLELF